MHNSITYYVLLYNIINIWHACSLSVSPDPDQSLIAMAVLKSTMKRAIQVYDYKTKHQTLDLEVKGIATLLLCVY